MRICDGLATIDRRRNVSSFQRSGNSAQTEASTHLRIPLFKKTNFVLLRKINRLNRLPFASFGEFFSNHFKRNLAYLFRCSVSTIHSFTQDRNYFTCNSAYFFFCPVGYPVIQAFRDSQSDSFSVHASIIHTKD